MMDAPTTTKAAEDADGREPGTTDTYDTRMPDGKHAPSAGEKESTTADENEPRISGEAPPTRCSCAAPWRRSPRSPTG